MMFNTARYRHYLPAPDIHASTLLVVAALPTSACLAPHALAAFCRSRRARDDQPVSGMISTKTSSGRHNIKVKNDIPVTIITKTKRSCYLP